LARRTGAWLRLVDAVEPPPAYLRLLGPGLAAVDEAARNARARELEALARRARRGGARVDTEILSGDPAIEIVRSVLRDRHDLVIVNAESPSRVGTTAMRLARKCPCPVWIARPARGRGFRVAAAVDAVPGDAARAALNAKVLGAAGAVARALGAELRVIHAWQAYGESMMLESVHRSDRRVVKKYVAETRAAHEKELLALVKASRLRIPRARVHLVKADARAALPAFAKSARIDLLVMGTVARTGLPAAVMGNTAETVANELTCSLLAVKPDEFVCPVRLEPRRATAAAG
jgi:universal stress protein E